MVTEIYKAIEERSWELLQATLKLPSYSPKQAGVFLSPLSAHYALALALNGAGPGSPNHSQLLGYLSGGDTNAALGEDVLNAGLGALKGALTALTPDGAEGADVVLANSIWSAPGLPLKEQYVSHVEKLFQAKASVASSVAAINAWVCEASQGLITHVMEEGTPFDAVLLNALYFRGRWLTAFAKSATEAGDFTTGCGDVKRVSMMSATFKRQLEYCEDKGDGGQRFQAVRIPYKGGAYAGVAILPGTDVTLPDAAEAYAALHGQARAWRKVPEVKLRLPRFRVESSMSLTPLLTECGVTDMFRSPDFSRLSSHPLTVTDVFHKTVVEVDEEGTEAAAVTGVVMLRSMVAGPLHISFDRPFLFLVEHLESSCPLILGVVNEPPEHKD